MIVDTSALVAILLGEPATPKFATQFDQAECVSISAGSHLELSVVIGRWKNPVLNSQIDEIVDRFDITVEPVTLNQIHIARQAYRDYGRGSGHPANLNFGD